MTLYQSQWPASDHLTYTHTPDDIHLFEVAHVDRHTIDEWFAIVTPLYQSHSEKDTVRVCLDLKLDEITHLTYAAQKARMLANVLEETGPFARYAVLRRPHMNLAMLDTMLSLTPKKPFTLRYFSPGEYRRAVRWLWEISL